MNTSNYQPHQQTQQQLRDYQNQSVVVTQNQANMMLQPQRQDSVDSYEYDHQNQDQMYKQQRAQQQPSLAQSLRQRREFQEHMDHERAQLGITQHKAKRKNYNHQNLPSQTDETGSAIRIRNKRPQTPRINLLKEKREQFRAEQPPIYNAQAQMYMQKPQTHLNPIIPTAKTSQITTFNRNTMAQEFQSNRAPDAQAGIATSQQVTVEKKVQKSNTIIIPTVVSSGPKKFKVGAIKNFQLAIQRQPAQQSEHIEPVADKINEKSQTQRMDDYDEDDDLNTRASPDLEFDDRAQEETKLQRPKSSDDLYASMAFTDMQDQFMEIMNQEQVEDVVDLNEKFLAMALGGIDVSELALIPKLELRMDTSQHSLQVTGEILPSLEYLKLNDSIVRSFRDLGTSFKNVRILHIARCELKEVQGIQAFEQLEELYVSHNSIEELFDVSFAKQMRILDLEGNNISQIEQIKYLKRISRTLTDLNFKDNPVAEEFAYFQTIQEVAPNLQILDDEPIGESFDEFVELKQNENRKQSIMKQNGQEQQLYEQALQNVMAKFGTIGFTMESLQQIDQNEIQLNSIPMITELTSEPKNESLVNTQIKTHNRDQKAQQSYQQNMDAQGFGSTFASGFYQTAGSGFGAASLGGTGGRPQSAFTPMQPGSALGNREMHPSALMTDAGDAADCKDERRAQEEFEESMRASSMSFFKTAKSTVMSTHNDLQSNSLNTEPDAENNADEASQQILAGGTMSLLRRKGKQAKDRRSNTETTDWAQVAKINSELFSCDILTLLQVFRKEAQSGTESRDRSAESGNQEDRKPTVKRARRAGSALRARSSDKKKAMGAPTNIRQDPTDFEMPILTPRTAANFAHILNDPVALKKAILEAKENEESRLLSQRKRGLRTVGGKIKKLFTFKKNTATFQDGESSFVVQGTGGSLTSEKIVVAKPKRSFLSSKMAAPIKMKQMKLKPSQIAFTKSAEAKGVDDQQ